jgi:hypothetical protein
MAIKEEKEANKRARDADDLQSGRYVSELRHMTSLASLNADCWFTLTEEVCAPYLDAMNFYGGNYFTIAINSHFVATLIPLYALYEKKDGTWNVPGLLDAVRQTEAMTEVDIAKLDNLVATVMPNWKNQVKVLRNRAFGHRSRDHSMTELFHMAKVRRDDWRHIIKTTKDILDHVSVKLGGSALDYGISGERDLLNVMKKLEEARQGWLNE